jgi:hypothetical protein
MWSLFKSFMWLMVYTPIRFGQLMIALKIFACDLIFFSMAFLVLLTNSIELFDLLFVNGDK